LEYFTKLKNKSDKTIYALKVMPNIDSKERKFNIAEIDFLSFCNHPNIVKFKEAYETQNSFWVVMEYMEGGTLDQAVKAYSFEESQIAYVIRDVLKAVEYLHSENLVHRDLKSGNIMLTIDGDIKLIDFGLCVDISHGPKTSMVGSPYWIPPEMIKREQHNQKADIWSLGICLIELCNQKPPCSKNPFKAMFNAATIGIVDPFDRPKDWTQNLQAFTKLCLCIDPVTRPEATALLTDIFLTNNVCSREQMKKIVSGIFLLNHMIPF